MGSRVCLAIEDAASSLSLMHQFSKELLMCPRAGYLLTAATIPTPHLFSSPQASAGCLLLRSTPYRVYTPRARLVGQGSALRKDSLVLANTGSILALPYRAHPLVSEHPQWRTGTGYHHICNVHHAQRGTG